MAQRKLSRLLGVWPSYPLAAALAVGTAGCGAELDSPVEVDTLRVLGVRKSAPYAAPGEDVELSLLWHDGTPFGDDGETRDVPIERAWIGGCQNPLGDFYYTCAPDVYKTLAALRGAQAGLSAEDVRDALESGVDSGAGAPEGFDDLAFLEGPLLADGVPGDPLAFGQVGAGDRFTLPVPVDNIIQHSPDDRERYGVLFTFFAACAGTLHVSLDVVEQTVPLVCLGEDGEPLGSDDFVLGYTSVYVYDDLRNENPVIDGFVVGDHAPWEPGSPFLCVNEDCLVPDEPLGEGEACTRHLECASEHCEAGVCAAPVSVECGVNVPCIQPCADDGDLEKCDEIPIRPLLDEAANAEDDPLSSGGGTTYEEQMWVNYHVERGNVGSVVRLVNDSSTGWNDDYGTDLFAPAGGADRQRMYIWAVVRDNRGGASWVRQTVYVEPGE